MAQIANSYNLTQTTDPQQFQVVASQAVNDVISAINGNLQLGQNIQGQIVSATFNSANSTVTVSHNLNKTGVNFIPVNKTKSCDVFYAGRQTNSTISLTGTAAATVTLLLF